MNFGLLLATKRTRYDLIYAYDRDGGEIVAYAYGKRNIATVRELEARLNALKVTYGNIAMDKWQSFVEIFGSERSNRSLAKIHFHQSIQLFLNKFMMAFSSGKVVSQEV